MQKIEDEFYTAYKKALGHLVSQKEDSSSISTDRLSINMQRMNHFRLFRDLSKERSYTIVPKNLALGRSLLSKLKINLQSHYEERKWFQFAETYRTYKMITWLSLGLSNINNQLSCAPNDHQLSCAPNDHQTKRVFSCFPISAGNQRRSIEQTRPLETVETRADCCF